MLMGSVARAIDALPFVVWVDAQLLEQVLPSPGFRPSIKSIENGFPWAELTRKIAPWDACASPPEDRFHEPSIVVPRAACATLAVEDLVNLLPLLIAEMKTKRHLCV